MENLSAEEVFQHWGRHKLEFEAWQNVTLRRQKEDKINYLHKLGWRRVEIKSLPSNADLAKDYLTQKYGEVGTGEPRAPVDWSKGPFDYSWEAICEDDKPKTKTAAVKPDKETVIISKRIELYGPVRKAADVQKEMTEADPVKAAEGFMSATYRAVRLAKGGQALPIPLGGCAKDYCLVRLDESQKGGLKGGHQVQKYKERSAQ